MFRKSKLVAISCALALGLATTTAAHAAQPQIDLLAKPADRFERSIETHKVERRYEALGERAKRLVEKAQRIAREPDYGLVGGVSQSTLDAIAACESGGDPTAVNAAGYYGKYQFDLGTWAVGRRQRQPGRGLRGRAGLPRLAALQPRRLVALAGLRLARARALVRPEARLRRSPGVPMDSR